MSNPSDDRQDRTMMDVINEGAQYDFDEKNFDDNDDGSQYLNFEGEGEPTHEPESTGEILLCMSL